MVDLCVCDPFGGATWWACVPMVLLEEEVHYAFISSYAYTPPE